ncbi:MULTISPECIES: hypothetical protein [Burkholderia]|uniref:Lipoprotein n=1 Tax=Burkholderia savannae TaxID=1637837 RepID=A0ABR5T931_9BURK|nr:MULTISPECIES: hypothetical protein [Burkholderia]AOJ73124.1 hypothetical protein WS78_20735 [Burkholderia savannae]AOJ85084.1 hypothetical protein WS86_26315 [Burkholderia savannae]AOK51091.1 hypothetical protein WT60_22535 [Burkholderia sp. MSMB617WGS]KGS08000.1 hypothetical protein X946_5857 [Burkholderia sp. ABCPW 111]KVG48940.1 hypothetical protein WS77_02620 [Burkholderia sp. MSMB0265]
MKHIAWMGLTLAALAGCSASSGPTYSVTQASLPGHPLAYRVACGGAFGKFETCTKVAARVCGERAVQTLERDADFHGDDRRGKPSSLTFDCASTPNVMPPADQ